MKSRTITTSALLTALLSVGAANSAKAATITLDYNGFNPGEEVSVRLGATPATVLYTQAAGVAGDSAGTFSFDLTSSGNYIIDLYGDLGSGGGTSTRTTHRVQFTYDDASGQVTNLIDGQNKVLEDFTSSPGTLLTLNTVPVFIDTRGYSPGADINNGYKVQIEFGSSGRANVGDSLAFADGDKALTLLNGLQYYAQYSVNQNGHRQNFTLTDEVITSNDGLLDEGTTVDAAGGAGTTHQLVSFNTKQITINTSGLSHVVPQADDRGESLNLLPAGFNGDVEVLAGNLGGYTVYMTNRTSPQLGFDVDAGGNVSATIADDPRIASVSGNTLTLRTVGIHIDAPDAKEGVVYNLHASSSETNTNSSSLLNGLAGDLDLTLLPSPGTGTTTYVLSGGGHAIGDARDNWRIVYDPVNGFSFTTWGQANGTGVLTGLQSFTTNAGYTLSFVPIPEPASAATLLGAGVLLFRRRSNRKA